MFVLLVRIGIIRGFFICEWYPTRREYNSTITRTLGHRVRIGVPNHIK